MNEPVAKVFYFGCDGQAGHFMHSSVPPRDLEERRAVSALVHSNPWGYGIDGGLTPKGKDVLALHHKDGWTALAMHDFTVDSRPGSNAVFLAQGTFDADQMIELAWEHFPRIAERIGKLGRSK